MGSMLKRFTVLKQGSQQSVDPSALSGILGQSQLSSMGSSQAKNNIDQRMKKYLDK